MLTVFFGIQIHDLDKARASSHEYDIRCSINVTARLHGNFVRIRDIEKFKASAEWRLKVFPKKKFLCYDGLGYKTFVRLNFPEDSRLNDLST